MKRIYCQNRQVHADKQRNKQTNTKFRCVLEIIGLDGMRHVRCNHQHIIACLRRTQNKITTVVNQHKEQRKETKRESAQTSKEQTAPRMWSRPARVFRVRSEPHAHRVAPPAAAGWRDQRARPTRQTHTDAHTRTNERQLAKERTISMQVHATIKQQTGQRSCVYTYVVHHAVARCLYDPHQRQLRGPRRCCRTRHASH